MLCTSSPYSSVALFDDAFYFYFRFCPFLFSLESESEDDEEEEEFDEWDDDESEDEDDEYWGEDELLSFYSFDNKAESSFDSFSVIYLANYFFC